MSQYGGSAAALYTIWERDKRTRRPHTQESRSAFSQQVPTRLQGTDMRYNINKKDPQKRHRLGVIIKTNSLEGLNMFVGANLTLNSDEDQGT